jgi:hypothetical protein
VHGVELLLAVCMEECRSPNTPTQTRVCYDVEASGEGQRAWDEIKARELFGGDTFMFTVLYLYLFVFFSS